MESHAEEDEFVTERWWHRLLKVVGALLALAAFSLAAAIMTDNARQFTYKYSYERNWDVFDGDEFECWANKALQRISCGELNDPTEFLADFIAATGAKKIKEGKLTHKEYLEQLRADGQSDLQIATGVIEAIQLKYKRATHWPPVSVALALTEAAGIALGLLIIEIGLFKAILYIVYGHTRIKKRQRSASGRYCYPAIECKLGSNGRPERSTP